MTDWIETLYRELDEWNYDGVAATFWWRDDDAQSPSAELDGLIGLAQKYDVPLALAVIPHGMERALASRVKPLAKVAVLQHGFSHENHAPLDEKKAELGDHRVLAAIHDELATGFAALRGQFGEQFAPVLVPPWNRIAARVMDGLMQTGFAGLSTFDPRPGREPAPGIRAVNTHVDLIDWKHIDYGGVDRSGVDYSGIDRSRRRRFIGAPRAVESMVAHLKDRRLGRVDSGEPTGLLTHHLVHDADCREFLEQLLAAMDEHPVVKWQTAATVFALDGR